MGAVHGAGPGQPARCSSVGLVSRTGPLGLRLTDYSHLQQRHPTPGETGNTWRLRCHFPHPASGPRAKPCSLRLPSAGKELRVRVADKKAHPPKGYWSTQCLLPVHPSWGPPASHHSDPKPRAPWQCVPPHPAVPLQLQAGAGRLRKTRSSTEPSLVPAASVHPHGDTSQLVQCLGTGTGR